MLRNKCWKWTIIHQELLQITRIVLFDRNPTMQLIMSSLLSRPLPSSKNRNFQNAAKSKNFFDNEFHLPKNKKIIFISLALHLAVLWNKGLGKLWNGLAIQPWQGNKSFLFPIKFQHFVSRLLFCWLFEVRVQFSSLTFNWMYLLPMNKSASFLSSRTIRIKLTTATANYSFAQNTQMIHKTDGHFVLHKNSNTSLHLTAFD